MTPAAHAVTDTPSTAASPTRRRMLGALTVLPLATMTACAPLPTALPELPAAELGRQTARRRTLPAPLTGDIRYWQFVPRGYADDPARAWPLIVFLHGSGERGVELQRVKMHGPPKFLDARPDFPAIVVSPQCDEGERWEPAQLHALVAQLKTELRLDADRITATGLSMGGRGVWAWAIAYPDELAAIAPVCGEGDPAQVCRIGQLPVWGFHGEQDTVVPFAGHVATLDALRACGGTPRFTAYPGVGHDAWNPAYADPALYDWLLAQRRRPR